MSGGGVLSLEVSVWGVMRSCFTDLFRSHSCWCQWFSQWWLWSAQDEHPLALRGKRAYGHLGSSGPAPEGCCCGSHSMNRTYLWTVSYTEELRHVAFSCIPEAEGGGWLVAPLALSALLEKMLQKNWEDWQWPQELEGNRWPGQNRAATVSTLSCHLLGAGRVI